MATTVGDVDLDLTKPPATAHGSVPRVKKQKVERAPEDSGAVV